MITYLDDILVYSGKALKDYVRKVYKMLKDFDKRNLRFRLEKYCFYQEEINFLKYIIGRDGVYINPQKIISIRE